MGSHSEDSLDSAALSLLLTMHKLMLASLLAVAAGLPIDDTAEVAAAKAEFQAAFDMAVAGAHSGLAPINNDIQAEQIASEYLASLTVSPPSMLSLPSTPSPATPMLLLDSHTLLLGFLVTHTLVCQSSLPLRLPRETTSNQNILQTIHRLSE